MRALALLAAALAALGGCASTPEASPQDDAAAKRFEAVPGMAVLYVYRPDMPPLEMNDPAIYIDERLLGSLLPGSFFRVELRPGARVLREYGSDSSSLRLETQAGQVYFVAVRVVADQPRYQPVPAGAARGDIVRCCALLENWARGQRPVLR